MKVLLSAALAAALVGCATHSGVTPMGGGMYLLAKQAGTGFGGAANLKAELLREADAYCTGKNQELEVIQAQENAGPYVFGHYPRAEVQFRCGGKR